VREVVPQKINDWDGEVGYSLRFFPETVELAEKITAALRAEGVPAGTRGKGAGPDWHIYSYMYPVLLQGSPTADKCPFDCPSYKKAGGKVSCATGTCPTADDLFSRVVSIGLNQWYTAGDCDNIARGINKVLRAYGTPDRSAKPWVP
jgi:hypothetical protein